MNKEKNIAINTPNGGYAEIIKHSVSECTGKEIITYSLKYGLIVHAEFLRHRVFSNSVKSNRAVSMKQIRKEVIEDPYVPIKFGAQQRGMVSSEEPDFKYAKICRVIWKASRWPAVGVHWILEKLGLHKEVTNRILNNWQWVRETVTFTESDNFYNLRLEKSAQKDIYVIAKAMQDAYDLSRPTKLKENEWHVPYVYNVRDVNGVMRYYDNDNKELHWTEAVKASTARCARSSYDNHDGSKSLYNSHSGKGRSDKDIYKDLVESVPMHGSCAEHQAAPMDFTLNPIGDAPFELNTDKLHFKSGITHIDKNGNLWSGNLMGWIQHRQIIDN